MGDTGGGGTMTIFGESTDAHGWSVEVNGWSADCQVMMVDVLMDRE